MKCAVVILNWNGKGFLQQFLPGIIKNNVSFCEVIVADNASTDDSVEFIKSNFPTVKIIQNDINGGFAKGYNDALKHVNAEYFVLLNSDVEVSENWIEPIIMLMDADKSIAACQPKILSFNNKSEFEYAGAAGGFIDRFAYPFCRGRIFNSVEKDLGQYNDVKEIFWATGACLFIRSDAFFKAGGLDEDFFAHMEEIDLCWRLKSIGYKIMYCPDSVVYHVGGGTLSKINPRKTFLNFRNNLFMIFKNEKGKKMWTKLWFRMNLDAIAGFKFLFEGNFLHFVAVLKAHYNFYKCFYRLLNKRKEQQKRVLIPNETGIYKNSIVVDFYLKGKKKFSELDQNAFVK